MVGVQVGLGPSGGAEGMHQQVRAGKRTQESSHRETVLLVPGEAELG